jgi:hypothetical protein
VKTNSWLLFIGILLALHSGKSAANRSEQVYEKTYQEISLGGVQWENSEETLYSRSYPYKTQMDALWDFSLHPENNSKLGILAKSLKGITFSKLALADQIRYVILLSKASGNNSKLTPYLSEMKENLGQQNLDARSVFVTLNQQSILSDMGLKDDVEDFKKHNQALVSQYEGVRKNLKLPTASKFRELYHHRTEDAPIYGDRSKLFVICRKNRNFPCLAIMKDDEGYPMYNQDGEIWNLPILSLSKFALPSVYESGNTPRGIFLINSVVPYKNAPYDYGKNHRLILDFLPRGENDGTVKALLPESHENEIWWREGYVAQEVGRDNLRIHGTGQINQNPLSQWFPFMPSLGCLKMREGTYAAGTFNDQRILLNQILKAQGLESKESNDHFIKAVLYVYELDELDEPVTLEDVKKIIR